jgi:hypothetical protein
MQVIDGKNYFVIRGPSGLGDAIYVNSIAQEMLKFNHNVAIRTKYPDVFKYLPVKTVPYSKGGGDREFNYGGKSRQRNETNQWQDLLIAARLDQNTPMSTKWELTNIELFEKITEKAQGRKVLVMSMPHRIFGDRQDDYGQELQPNWKKFIPILKAVKDTCYVVQIGRGHVCYRFDGISLDWANRTSVSDVMDFGVIGDIFLGQCGFIIPLAEGMNKPLFTIFSANCLTSKDSFLNNITGRKVLSGKHSAWCFDNSKHDEELVEQFRRCTGV